MTEQEALLKWLLIAFKNGQKVEVLAQMLKDLEKASCDNS